MMGDGQADGKDLQVSPKGTRQTKSTPRRWREFAPRSRSGDLSPLNHTNCGSATQADTS